MNEKFQKIKQMPVEELILLGIKGIIYNSINKHCLKEYKYFSIKDICLITSNVCTLEEFENEYSVTVVNLVLDGEN